MPVAESQAYFLKVRGKVMGPFPLAQLQSLKERGRVQPDHEVSTDRRTWQPASRIDGLFPQAAAFSPPDDGGAASAAPGVDDGPKEWYYTVDEQQQGPVSRARLESLILDGDIFPEDLVFHPSLSEWRSAESVPGLFPFRNRAGGRRKRKTRDEPLRMADSKGLWDALLRYLKEAIRADDLETLCRALILLGSWAMLLALLAGPGYLLVMAIKTDSIEGMLLSAAAFGGVAVLRYIGRRMCGATHDLVRASPHRLSSSAFPDSLALVLLLAGVTAAVMYTFWGMQEDTIALTVVRVVMGFQALVMCGYAALAALHTDWLGIKCGGRVRAGDEGVGVISLILKVWLRTVPVAFGIGAITAAATLTAAIIMLVIGGDAAVNSIVVASAGASFLLFATLTPPASYLIMLTWSIVMDFIQSVLVLPEKLSALSSTRDDGDV